MHPITNIAVRAARAAGNIQLRYFERTERLTITSKSLNDFVTEVDRASEQAIIEIIHNAYPSHAILAEESGSQAGDDYQWIIDPLDGTTNYLHGFPQFSVSIAVKHKGALMSGVVYDPLHEELFTATKGDGALLNDRRIRVSKRQTLQGALLGTGYPYRDQSTLEIYLNTLRELIKETAGIRRPGSAALDFAYVAAGRTDGFWELGLAPWDFAAGALLVTEAGGTVTDLAGGDRFFETGNIMAGGLRVHAAMLDIIRPQLRDQLLA